MYCPNCGAQNADDATRCANCGNILQPIQTPGHDEPTPGMTGESSPDIRTYLGWAITLTILCFVLAFVTFITGLGVITGIIAIVFAAQTNSRIGSGNYTGAREASRVARILCWVTFGILMLGVVIIIILVILFVIALLASATPA